MVNRLRSVTKGLHRRFGRTSDLVERLSQEIKRRTDVELLRTKLRHSGGGARRQDKATRWERTAYPSLMPTTE
jgi:hypothetical protein